MICHFDGAGNSQEARRRFDLLRLTVRPLLKETQPNPEILRLFARCCARFARGSTDPLAGEAAERYEQAYQVLRQRVEADQNETEPRNFLSDFASSLIALHHQSGRPGAAVQVWRRQLHFREALLNLHPGILKDDIEVVQDLCGLLKLHVSARRQEDALTVTRQAIAFMDRCPDFRDYCNLSDE